MAGVRMFYEKQVRMNKVTASPVAPAAMTPRNTLEETRRIIDGPTYPPMITGWEYGMDSTTIRQL
jgi:hypothetical protein